MRCPRCGTVNPNVNNFCGNCGVPLVDFAASDAVKPSSVIAEPPSVRLGSPSSSIDAQPVTRVNDAVPNLPPSAPSDTALLEDDLEPAPTTSFTETTELEPERSHEATTISGPSFLGLTGSGDSDQNSYLLEDEQSSRRGAWFVFALVVIAIFVGVGWLEWNNIKTGRLNIPFLKSADSQPLAKSSATPAPTATVQSSTPNAQPDNSKADDRLSTNDTSDSDSAPTTSETKSEKPANESAATEASQSRQAKEANQHRATATSGAIADDENSTNKASAKPKTARTVASDSQPDPRQNKMLVLGEKYLYGRGVTRSCQQAMVYFRAAADDNNAPAMSHLGALYSTGECVKQDRAQAYSWLRRAHDADPSNEWIERDMNMMWRDMSTQERASISR